MGSKVQEFAKKKGISYAEFKKLMEKKASEPTIQKVWAGLYNETGEDVKLSSLRYAAEILGVPVKELL